MPPLGHRPSLPGCVRPSTSPPALAHGDKASCGGHASPSGAVVHQPAQGPGNYRERMAPWNWIIRGPGAAQSSCSLADPSSTSRAAPPGLPCVTDALSPPSQTSSRLVQAPKQVKV